MTTESSEPQELPEQPRRPRVRIETVTSEPITVTAPTPEQLRSQLEEAQNSLGNIFSDTIGDVLDEPVPIREHNDARSRQTDLIDSSIFENPVCIIGAGAIGSFTALTLAKMGFTRLTVFDDDEVSVENISNQFYRYKDIGSNKVRALYNMIQDFEDINITEHRRKWDNTRQLKGYIIMAVDTMTARKQIYKFIKRNSDVYGFIDGRMGGQQAEVFSVDLIQQEHKKIYEQYLWSEDEASELPCTQKAVMYNVLWIASQIANNLRLMMEEKPFPPVMQMDFENVNHINVKH